MWNATDHSDRLLAGLGQRPVGSTAYATASAARVTVDGTPVFPDARRWLRRHQHSDGSWGGMVPSPHDRLVATLAAVLALTEVRQDWAVDAVRAGLAYLRLRGSDWRHARGETIGFELIAPALIEHAVVTGLLPTNGYADLVALRADKLARCPASLLAGQPTTLLYSLEALDPLIRPGDVATFLAPDGSMTNNPPATAAVWAATGAQPALDYLRRATESTRDGGMPEVFPIDVFEPAWVLYLLGRAGLVPSSAASHVARLNQLASRVGTCHDGFGFGEHFPVPDSDDTAMVANVLHAFGHDDSRLLAALLSFETDTHFRGYSYERGASVSANARVLEALARQAARYAAQIAKATAFLLDTRHEQAWWHDKWHLSPYYATAQAVFGLAGTAPQYLAGTWRWLLHTQHANGAWGMLDGSPEETAYAVMALHALEPHFGPAPVDTHPRVHRYLRDHLTCDSYAELWIGKGLYTPLSVVRAAVMAGYRLSGTRARIEPR